MEFYLEGLDTESNARAATLKTGHGVIQTPVFMPVGTAGTVKAVHQRELAEDIKAQIILGNTYHLFLRPGLDVLQMAGGIHNFMNWQRPVLTDSGGYQVFSLSANRKFMKEGVRFSSHIDGTKHLFTPENVVEKQRIIGSDIMMALDECTPYPCEYSYAKTSLQMTNEWLLRGYQHYIHTDPLYGYKQLFFPIVQGSVFKDLRKISAEFVASLDCQGNAIGGLSVGEPAEEMYAMTETVNAILPKDKPRYLMGVGTPENMLECIALGVDMFDCVMPTRNARNGMLFTKEGIINIRNVKWKNDFSPLDETGTCFVDTCYSKAYLRHLIIAKEILGAQIATIHNLSFYLWLVAEARRNILEGSFSAWKKIMIKKVSTRL